MSVKTSRAVNEMFDALLSVPLLSRIASNSFYTGFVVVIIIVLLAAFVYRDSDSLFTKSLRLIFWGAVFTSMILALRERKLASIVDERHETAGTRELFSPESDGGIQHSPSGAIDVGIVEQYPGASARQEGLAITGSGPASNREPLLTRADTSAADADRPLISDAQLAAVANRRGYAIVRMSH